MAIAKKARPVVKKAKSAKPSHKKMVIKKAAVKPKALKKPASVKPKAVAKKKIAFSKTKIQAKPLKKMAKPEPKKTKPDLKVKSAAITPKAVKLPVKKIVNTIPVKKEIPKQTPLPVKSSGKKPDGKAVSKEAVKNPPAKSDAKLNIDKTSGKQTVPVSDKLKGAKEKPALPVRPDDKMDPLHVKAAKAMKELSERMDLNKVRPRLQAGSAPPPKIIHKPQHPPLKLIEPVKTNKIKFQIELEFRCSPKILFNYLSDSSGLAGWFADEVHTRDKNYTFVWEGSETDAKLVAIKDMQLVRFQWADETDGTYFQFEIKEDDITSDVALIITDFANPGEKETNIRLWESQVQKLRLLLGSF